LNVIEAALGQSHEVKDKVEACADDLATANDRVKERIAEGKTTLPAEEALRNNAAVEVQVKEAADDLEQVTDNLSHGVEQVKKVEQDLIRSQQALVDSEVALATSRQAEQAASRRALHDQKTGLPNRTLFDDRLAQAISGAERHGWGLAVLFLDLDRFKAVNDTHGHAAGDAVLKVVADRLLKHARDEDTVCRNGGDEFLTLLIDPGGRVNVARIAGFLRATLASPIAIDDLELLIMPSIGISLYPDDGTTADQLVEHADAAMYRCKDRQSAWEFYGPAEIDQPIVVPPEALRRSSPT
jgi:diguanylate cyclase (GGDEF)-like protein